VIIEAEIGRVAYLEGLRARIDRERVGLLLWQEYLEFKVRSGLPALFHMLLIRGRAVCRLSSGGLK
jgi:hypothetical protein